MNLDDYQKLATMLFGECQGECGSCDPCRIRTMVEQVWESGRRSGASSSAERKRDACLFGEWDWAGAQHDLEDYILKISPAGHHGSRGEALAYLQKVTEAAGLWSQSRPKVERRRDWTAFLKIWIGKELSMLIPIDPQPGLFAASSQGQSPQSRKVEDQRDTYHQASAMSSQSEPGSRSNTSSPPGTVTILRGSRSTRRT